MKWLPPVIVRASILITLSFKTMYLISHLSGPCFHVHFCLAEADIFTL